jgi:hypothetical protein
VILSPRTLEDEVSTTMNYIHNPDERWRMQTAKMKLMFPHLNEDDFKYDYGMREAMMNKLRVKVGKSREELNILFSGL